MNLSLAMPFWLNWLWKSDLKIRTRSYGHILPMPKIAIGESMEEENLLLNRNKKKKKRGDLCGVWGYLFSNAEEGA